MVDDNKSRSSRRKVLSTLGAAGVFSLAGCSGNGNGGGNGDGNGGGNGDGNGGDSDGGDSDGGDSDGGDSDGGDSEEVEFDPPGGSVETMYHDSSGRFVTTHETWVNAMGNHWPNGVETAFTTVGPAPGVQAFDTAMKQPPDGRAFVGNTLNSIIMLPYLFDGWDDLGYSIKEDVMMPFRYFVTGRGYQVSHHVDEHRGVSEHFEWTWDDAVGAITEDVDTWRQGLASATHLFYGTLLYTWEPRIDFENDVEMIMMPGGGEARAANRRGDLYGYLGGLSSNLVTRNEFYKTQFLIADPENQPQWVENLRNTVIPEDWADDDSIDEEERKLPMDAFITETSYPSEKAVSLVNATVDEMAAYMRSDTPQNIVDVYTETFKAAEESGEPRQRLVEDLYDAQSYDPNAEPESLTQNLRSKYELLHENEEVAGTVESALLD